MFSFFKKKPKPVETAIPSPEMAPAVEPPLTPPAVEPVVASPAIIAETVTIVPAAAPALAEPAAIVKKSSWAERLKAGLSKTRDKLGKSFAGLFGGGKIDEDLYEELETLLLTADMGMGATTHLLKDVRERVSLKGLKDSSELKGALKDALYDLISPLEQTLNVNDKKPFVIMMAGVNGAGKTTSIGKLAKYYQSQGKSVLLAAGDTFRAAAREQLMAWGERNDVTVIAQQGGDSAAVCYDAIQAAIARNIDIVLADTAGRLPTQLHLMEEIKKVKRVIQKALPEAPHEIILVVDANIGQNTLTQVSAFDEALGLTGLILSKLDGSAKGGVIAAIAKQHPVPLRFIGIGESIDDLRPFNSKDYIDALFD
ncbi:signal recognition particle-docking protein FtsY [Neisseriaceae bacterium TC5R-5]|nr:signal recognition particle-docking protein FtsY [Neisseriaceae bacterium TC5R-5]